ncbi:MAG: urease subunit alpha [Actinomycetota bacterium]|nr:urease subunit alpha [Actinomycetota bacterium]
MGDTDLWIRIERDLTDPADQALWGYAKNFRSRMSQHDRASSESELDAVIAGAIVLDPTLGVLKADIGIKDGRIAGIGRAGNPDITSGVDLTIGPGTWPIPSHGLIVTAGAIDSHVHLLSPRLIPVALSAGVTTLITAGFEEPAWRMRRTLEAFERLPVNIGLQASARTEVPGHAERMIEAGAVGLKIHEDWGAYPRIVDATLSTAEAFDVAVCVHTDGLNESCELDETVAAIGGRTVHAYHVEGVGGGHIPDLIAIVRESNVICSSTTPGLPYGRATEAEHLDMILITHEGNPSLPEDVAAARERIRPTTMAAEGPLHELGGISIINSDSQGMGRIGESVRRTWQLAHVMKAWRASEAGSGWPDAPRATAGGDGEGDGDDDNDRVLRYLAKYTVEPARTHGIAGEVGSLSPGHLADLVLWSADSFGAKPLAVMKAGIIAWAPVGEGNATVHSAEPTRYGPDWGAAGDTPRALGTTFVSRASIDAGIVGALGTARRVMAVAGTRGLTRADLVANTAVPAIEVDPSDGTVRLGGRVLAADAVAEVPLNRRYFFS